MGHSHLDKTDERSKVMVVLFERNRLMQKRGGGDAVEMDPSYRAWLGTNPAPGEVFVDTGEASAENSRKLRWSPSKEQRDLIKTVIAREIEFVNQLYQNDDQSSYADHMKVLVEDTLRNVGVDPVTLRPLSEKS
jgi:hypothetical protein